MRYPAAHASAFALLLAVGCAPSIEVDHWQPAAIDVAGARHAVVTDAFGRDESVAAIGALGLDALRQSPWFIQVTDLRGRDRLETDGVEAWLRQGTMAADAVYLRFDVYEDLAVVTRQEQLVEQPDGSVAVIVEEQIEATTLLALTVADHDGVLIDEHQFEGRHDVTGPVDDHTIAAAMEQAARAAVATAVASVTPRRDRVSVPVDERDEAVNRVVRPVVDGGFVARMAAADALADLHTTPAVYNRAVLLESVQDVETALTLYRQAAHAADAPPFAAEVLAGAEARAADARALGL